MGQSVRRLLKAMKIALFERDGVEEIFRHARNLVVATLIIAAGINAIENTTITHATGMVDLRIAGYVVGGLGIMLFGLNLMDGLYRLSKAKSGLLLQIIVVAIYVFITFRAAQLIVVLRTP